MLGGACTMWLNPEISLPSDAKPSCASQHNLLMLLPSLINQNTDIETQWDIHTIRQRCSWESVAWLRTISALAFCWSKQLASIPRPDKHIYITQNIIWVARAVEIRVRCCWPGVDNLEIENYHSQCAYCVHNMDLSQTRHRHRGLAGASNPYVQQLIEKMLWFGSCALWTQVSIDTSR
jgi:hypothetical protein